MIEFQNVSFVYDESEKGGVHHLNLRIPRGECVLFCGASGCGKTTVTRLVNGLIPHFFDGSIEGKVLVNGFNTQETPVAELSDAVGTVFQNPRTQFFNTDTDSEIVFGLENRGMLREAMLTRLEEMTKELRLAGLRGRSIFELSGGEKQKIACASVYATAPEILVFDEPSSNLDMKSMEELSNIIRRAKSTGKTILIAEHRIWYLMDLVDRVIYMKDGRIEADMCVEVFRSLPENAIEGMGLRIRSLSSALQKQKETSVQNLGEAIASNQKESTDDKTIYENTHITSHKNTLVVDSLRVRIGNRDILSHLSFQVQSGEIVAIAGENGAGKTTLARAICGLQKTKDGLISWNGTPLHPRLRKQKSYMVMQDVGHQLFTDSVMAECELGIRHPNRDGIARALKMVDLLECRERHPLSLSGGQMQRLAVVVSNVCGKEILVFDEPTSGLDLKSMEEVGELARLLAAQGKILLIITHDIEFMKRICTRILLLRDGKVTEDLARERKEEIIVHLRGEE